MIEGNISISDHSKGKSMNISIGDDLSVCKKNISHEQRKPGSELHDDMGLSAKTGYTLNDVHLQDKSQKVQKSWSTAWNRSLRACQ